MLLIILAFNVIGVRLDQPRIGLVGLFLVAATLIIPQMKRHDRFLRALQCPHCQRAAGRYKFRHSRLHLLCQHCGQESPTDCVVNHAGGPPMKQ